MTVTSYRVLDGYRVDRADTGTLTVYTGDSPADTDLTPDDLRRLLRFAETGEEPPFSGIWAHTEATHDEDGELTEYGEWWVSEGFPELLERVSAAVAEADRGLTEWQRG